MSRGSSYLIGSILLLASAVLLSQCGGGGGGDSSPPPPSAVCGDGVVGAGEACDAGAGNSDVTPDACRTDCTLPVCGDGVTDTGEACDDGNTADGDTCNSVCQAGVCTDPLTRPCGTNVGVCVAGTETCTGGAWGACAGEVGPATGNPDESAAGLCNGLDDNCDGTTDEGCACVALDTQPCGSSVGACSQGTQTCQGDGTWGACVGEVGPTAETCNDGNIDNNCDGQVDEGCTCTLVNQDQVRACSVTNAEGECTGTETCDAVVGWSMCTAPTPQAEVCNGLDDNCDGFIDEGLTAPATGNITTVAAANIIDGETFTIDDGINIATVFEFDKVGDGVAGSVSVDISGISTADEVRDAIITAVNSTGSTLLMTALNGGAAIVILTNDVSSAAGNQPISETVADSAFTVSGMSGGCD